MKTKFLVITGLLFLFSTIIFAQTEKIIGIWFNEEKTSKIQVYKGNDNKFYAKIIWLKDPLDANKQPRTDVNNPNKNNRNKPLIGLNILKVTQNKSNGFEGSIYDPKNGKEYDCTITYSGDDKLKLRGYIGISMIGRTSYWTRTEK